MRGVSYRKRLVHDPPSSFSLNNERYIAENTYNITKYMMVNGLFLYESSKGTYCSVKLLTQFKTKDAS